MPTATDTRGGWQGGKRYGQGVLEYANGKRYEGGWRRDKRFGHGVFEFPNGDRYEGEFRYGMINGNGTFLSKGMTVSGRWTNGCFKQGERWAVVDTSAEVCGFK